VNYELPLDMGDDLDELVAKVDAILDEQFLREVDEALERLRCRGDGDAIAPPLAG
jgi:hypothetical protein